MKNMDENKRKNIKTKKIPKVVCYHCNKKLKLYEQIKCSCGHHFCPKHMNRHSHNCTFDMKTKVKIELKNENPKMNQKTIIVS